MLDMGEAVLVGSHQLLNNELPQQRILILFVQNYVSKSVSVYKSLAKKKNEQGLNTFSSNHLKNRNDNSPPAKVTITHLGAKEHVGLPNSEAIVQQKDKEWRMTYDDV